VIDLYDLTFYPVFLILNNLLNVTLNSSLF